MSNNNDPVVASYNVYLKPKHAATGPTSSEGARKLMVLQYPAHRSASKPYSASRSQKPVKMKHKPSSGLVEVEVPIITTDHYNADAGSRFGKALSESRTVQTGGTHGLAGGFSSTLSQTTTMRNIPAHDEEATTDAPLQTQVLTGKTATASERDPIYFLGSVRGENVELFHLDSVVQLRPQLPYIDAEEELQRQRQLNGLAAASRGRLGLDTPARVESKAVEMKLKDTKEDARERGLNENSRMLRDIQMEQWQFHEWIEADEDGVNQDSEPTTTAEQHISTAPNQQLRSALSNGDWLDKMSAPREDGKKGLLAKLRGRERERARRKKAEEEKRSKAKAASVESAPRAGTLLEQSSDSGLSSPEASDLEEGPVVIDVDRDVAMEDVEIKEEPEQEMKDAEQGPSTSAPGLPSRNNRPRKGRQAVTTGAG